MKENTNIEIYNEEGKNMEQIDILLATYNGEKYIREQIDSILAQTYKNFRLIISDDCSTDNTVSIIKEIAEKEKRIILYQQKVNLGYVKNFEFLLTKVESKLYMLSDQDDVWLPEKIEKTYNKLMETESDLVFTDLEVVDQNLNCIYPSFNDYMKLSKKIKKYKSNYQLQYLYNCITGCTLMCKSKFIQYIVPFPNNSKYVIHDSWIGTVIVNKGKVEYLNEKTIKYRQHSSNQVGTNKISHNFKKFQDVRFLLIDVKIDLFNTYVNNDSIFPEKIKRKNKEALDYFKEIRNKKNLNIKKWRTFNFLYKNETFMYYIENFLIMNIPIIAKTLFKVRKLLLRALRLR